MQAGQWRSPKNSVIAGASAGFVSSVVTCPLDVIKTKLQAGTAARGSPGYLGIAGGFFGLNLDWKSHQYYLLRIYDQLTYLRTSRHCQTDPNT